MHRTVPFKLTTKCLWHSMICLVCLGTLPAEAAPITLAEYYAGDYSVAWSPSQWGWYDPSYFDPPQYIDGYVSSVTGSAGGGSTAWQIHNPGISGVEPHYFFFLQQPQYVAAARENGWNLQANAQFVAMEQGIANQGLAVTFDGRYYGVAIDTDASGALIASIPTTATSSTVLELSPPSGAGDYHAYELRSAPNTQLVSFFYDGEVKYTWSGVAENHPNKFEFGSLTDLGAGSMNFREAHSYILDAGPTATEQGDYNDDGIVDLADFTLWRNTLGSTSKLAADGNGNLHIDAGDYNVWKRNFGLQTAGANNASSGLEIPEPSTWTLVLLAVSGGVLHKKGRNALCGTPTLFKIAP